MSLDKAIASGKEHRKPYTGSKAIDCSCRNHGSCDWCLENRRVQWLREKLRTEQHLQDYYEERRNGKV